jgi:hypothetical protein
MTQTHKDAPELQERMRQTTPDRTGSNRTVTLLGVTLGRVPLGRVRLLGRIALRRVTLRGVALLGRIPLLVERTRHASERSQKETSDKPEL